MRDIKFRVWDESEEKIKQVELLACYNLNDNFFDNRGPLMQYTGLKDKNGKEIYEGDICIGGNLHLTGGWTLNNDNANVVRFVDGMFKLGNVSLISFNKRTEVIGNVHENPELLEGQCE